MVLTDLLPEFTLCMFQVGISHDLECPMVLLEAAGDHPNEQGEHLLREFRPLGHPHENWCGFCSLFRSDQVGGDSLCAASDVKLFNQALRGGSTYAEPCQCHLGLTEFRMPVAVGEVVGVGVPGQRISNDNDVLDRVLKMIDDGKLAKRAEDHLEELEYELAQVRKVQDLPGAEEPENQRQDDRQERVRVWLRSMNMPWLSEDEKEVAVEFCVRVTDRAYQLAEVAGERFRLISATHAMRQPVAALRADAYSLMDLLSATNFDEGEAVELARAIDAGAGRAMTSLQGYIHALQDQTGKAPHYAFRDSVKLGDLLLTVKNQYENAAAARHMEITLSSPVWGLPDIRADQQALKTSFGQLVDNAVKYGFAGTIDDPREIIVNGHHNNQDGTVIISVDDYGLTIDEEDLTRIFDYYEIGSHRDKRRTVPTSGIGLGVANSIVRAHGGRTWAVVNSRSTRPSDAAPDWTQAGRVVFHVELPIAGPAEETP